MPIYSKRINASERRKAWAERYEADTSFEPMYQDDFDKGVMSWAAFCRANLRWFSDWAQETQDHLERRVPR